MKTVPLAPNTVFNEFVADRLRVDFRAVRNGLFGHEINREKEFKSVLVRQGDHVYAVYHINDSPLSLTFPGMDWDWLICNLHHGQAVARIERLSFLAVDPRIVIVPVSEAKARELGSKIYTVPKDPFKFPEAILVGANESYYGECKFQLDVDNPQYIRMQRERFSWLVGKFQPSSGDMVFTKGGDLLGVMVNKEYCLLLTELAASYNLYVERGALCAAKVGRFGGGADQRLEIAELGCHHRGGLHFGPDEHDERAAFGRGQRPEGDLDDSAHDKRASLVRIS